MCIVFEFHNTVAIKNGEKSDADYIQIQLFLQQENYIQLLLLSFLATTMIMERRGVEESRNRKNVTQHSTQLFSDPLHRAPHSPSVLPSFSKALCLSHQRYFVLESWLKIGGIER